jgi:hypothetical protein
VPAGAASFARTLREALPEPFQAAPDPLDYQARIAAENAGVLGDDGAAIRRRARRAAAAAAAADGDEGDSPGGSRRQSSLSEAEILLLVNSLDGGGGGAGGGAAVPPLAAAAAAPALPPGLQLSARTEYGISRPLDATVLAEAVAAAAAPAAAAASPPPPPPPPAALTTEQAAGEPAAPLAAGAAAAAKFARSGREVVSGVGKLVRRHVGGVIALDPTAVADDESSAFPIGMIEAPASPVKRR